MKKQVGDAAAGDGTLSAHTVGAGRQGVIGAACGGTIADLSRLFEQIDNEGGVRVPTFVRWAGVTLAGARTDHLVTSIDYYPTLMELIGADVPVSVAIDGVSFADVVRTGKSVARRPPIYWHFPAYLPLGERGGRYAFRTTPAAAVRDGRWKLIEFFEDGQLELYDLKIDQSETTNLALERPRIVALLREDLHRWRAEVKARISLGPNPAFDPDRGPLPRADPVTWEMVAAKLSALRRDTEE